MGGCRLHRGICIYSKRLSLSALHWKSDTQAGYGKVLCVQVPSRRLPNQVFVRDAENAKDSIMLVLSLCVNQSVCQFGKVLRLNNVLPLIECRSYLRVRAFASHSRRNAASAANRVHRVNFVTLEKQNNSVSLPESYKDKQDPNL